MRSASECAEAARKCIRLAAREQDPARKARLLRLARANGALARANLLQQRREKERNMTTENKGPQITVTNGRVECVDYIEDRDEPIVLKNPRRTKRFVDTADDLRDDPIEIVETPESKMDTATLRRYAAEFNEEMNKTKWYKHPAYTIATWSAVAATFFLVPLPWYFALLAAFGVFVLVSIPMMISFHRTDEATITATQMIMEDPEASRLMREIVAAEAAMDEKGMSAQEKHEALQFMWAEYDAAVQRFLQGRISAREKHQALYDAVVQRLRERESDEAGS
jgi:preprotein translocase subunit SecE